MMCEVYVLDYFMNKHLKILQCPEDIFKQLNHGEKIVYRFEEKGAWKDSIGQVVWYPVQTDKEGVFERKMNEEERADFECQQDYAQKLFPLFKKKFKEKFSTSKPITARYNPLMDQLYFYFYSEERYLFGDFVKEFREELGKNIFLFQVWARDMMRIDPHAKEYMVGCDCGMLTACQGLGQLPSVEVECISLQGMDGRDMERLKGRCWKLKCSLMYELEIYKKESSKFPQKWSVIKCPGSNENGVVSSYNIMTREVVLRTEDGVVLRVPLSTLQEQK